MRRVHPPFRFAEVTLQRLPQLRAAHLRFDHDLLRSRAGRRRDLLDPDIFLAVVANRFHVSPLSLPRRSLR